MALASFRPHWQLRAEALTPAAVVAPTASALAALKRWLDQLSASERAALREWHLPELSVVLLGSLPLPWFDGVCYAGVDPEAAQLWLPTHLEPGLPLALLQRAVLRRSGSPTALLWHQPACMVALT
jgi:hypothetical protein